MKIERIFLKNFLIIKRSNIELSSGLTIVTGETGSGKSLFVSAMKALRGERITKSLLGKWGDRGEVGAEIFLESRDGALKELLNKNEIDFEDDRLILRRIFGERGGNYLNDAPVGAALIGEIFGDMIEIGSQFENRELLKKDYRLKIIDSQAGNNEKLAEYREIFHKIQEVKKNIEELRRDDDPAKRDYLEYQIREIEKLETYENEDKIVADKINFIENRAKIVNLSSEMTTLLNSAADSLNGAEELSSRLSELVENRELFSRLSSAAIEVDDLYKTLALVFSKYEEEVDNIDEIQARFDKLSTLFIKHKVSSSLDLIEKMNSLSEELFEMNKIPQKIAEHEKELEILTKKALEIAGILRKKRLQTIKTIENHILKYLLKFGMYGVKFLILLNKSETINEFGFDEAVFLVNAIGTDKMYELSSLSGGELSRLLLAVKLIDDDGGKVILFDEIDSSIGGETAGNAAAEMRKNSDKNQIVAVTHFPQTAAKAANHILVKKSFTNGEIETEIHLLTKSERIKEIARMMGDSKSVDFLETAEKMVEI